MNKKLLIIILLASILVLPSITLAAATIEGFAKNLKDAFDLIGPAMVAVGWVIAGVLYLTSAGSPERMKTAKTAIVACIIGTILVIISKGAEAFVQQYWK